MLKLTVQRTGHRNFNGVVERVSGALKAEMAAAASTIADGMRSAAPRATGRLAQEIRVSIGSPLPADVSLAYYGPRISGPRIVIQGRAANYAGWVIRGTSRHRIAPRPGAVLYLGNNRFAKAVDHPGTHPNDFSGAVFAALYNSAMAQGLRSAVLAVNPDYVPTNRWWVS